MTDDKGYFVDPSAVVDRPCEIGAGTMIWHFTHVMKDTKIGERCVISQNVFIASHAVIGNNVKIQNNVSIFEGVVLEDDVFCGPSMVFTNVPNPRSAIVRRGQYTRTLVRKGATLGANSTILCGITIGENAFIGAGAVVTRDVPDFALILGVPGRVAGWMSAHGDRLPAFDSQGFAHCPATGEKYQMTERGVVRLGVSSEE